MLDFLFHDQLDLVKSFDVDIEPIETNVELDYSIIQVKGGAYDEFGGILESPAGDSQFREVRAPNDREGLLIFHHPLGLPKYVTRGGCRAAGTATSDGLVFHLCATEGGSSGAPIFSSDGALVGLHIGTTAGDDFNLAVPFNDIVERSPLIQQLLDLTPRRSINNEEVPTHFESNKAVKFARFAVYNGQVKSTEESAVLSAISHFYGENNRKQDFEEAATWFHSAARSGDPFAQAALGDLYVEGLGVEKDYEEAARWYRLAADQGNKVAQFLLGEFYEFGSGGVGTNFKKAANLFRLSAVQGYAPAQHDLASLYTRSIVATPHDDKDAIEWLLAAAEQDYLPAQLDLGWAYEKGIGVEPSAEKAISWYLRAGESGDFDPKDTVDRLRQ